jgi:translation initiation factor 2 subunit 3
MNFYSNVLPLSGELAVIEITKIDNTTGYYGKLVEYNNQEIFVPVREIKMKRNKNLSSTINIGKLDVICILDKEELLGSKRNITELETNQLLNEYKIHKKIHEWLTIGQKVEEEMLKIFYEKIIHKDLIQNALPIPDNSLEINELHAKLQLFLKINTEPCIQAKNIVIPQLENAKNVDEINMILNNIRKKYSVEITLIQSKTNLYRISSISPMEISDFNHLLEQIVSCDKVLSVDELQTDGFLHTVDSLMTFGTETNAIDSQWEKPIVNIGLVGMVSHGKTTLIQSLTGVDTRRYKNEIKTNKTIKLGYTSISITKCTCASSTPTYLTEYCGNIDCCEVKASIIDCPGHNVLLQTMISGACIMDICMLVVAADEPCPQPQTYEHMAIIKAMKKTTEFICLQNKIDLLKTRDDMEMHQVEVNKFIEKIGLTADYCPIVPISAQNNININIVLECLYDKINIVLKNKMMQKSEIIQKADDMGIVVRAFDVNLPGTSDIKGAIIGGSIINGQIKLNDKIRLLPMNIETTILNIKCEHHNISEANSGGLIALQTDLPPKLCDKLIGSIIVKSSGLESEEKKEIKILKKNETITFRFKSIKKRIIFLNSTVTLQCLGLSVTANVINIGYKDITFQLNDNAYFPENQCILVLFDNILYGYSLDSVNCIGNEEDLFVSWSKYSYQDMLEMVESDKFNIKVKVHLPVLSVVFQNSFTTVLNYEKLCSTINCIPFNLAKYINEELSLKSWSINSGNQLIIKGKIKTQSLEKAIIKFCINKMCKRCKCINTEIVKVMGVNKLLCKDCDFCETIIN